MSLIACPLKFIVDHRLALTLQCVERPCADELERYALDWIAAHVEAPLRDALQAYAERGFGQIHVMPASHPTVVGLLQNARSYETGDDEDPLRRNAVRWCIVICAEGFSVPSVPHVWFARVAAHALAQRFDTGVIDVAHALCDRRYNDASFAKVGQGYLHMSSHLRFLGSGSTPGCMRLSSLGMHVFGLPELELAACPQALLHVGQLLLLGAAQHIVHAAMQFVHDADKETLMTSEPLHFAVPTELDVTSALLFEATEGGANEDGGSTRAQLVLPEDFSGRLLRLMPPEGLDLTESAWLQRVCDELLGGLSAIPRSQPDTQHQPDGHA